MQAIIASHPSAIMPNETKFYSVLVKRFPNRSRIGEAEVFDVAVDYALSRRWIREMDLDERRVRELCRDGNRTWETILLAILTSLRERHGVERVGEKSPAHVRHIGTISERLPRSKFVHMMRDPRAVAVSKMRTGFGSRYIEPAIAAWRDAARQHHAHGGRLGPERYMLVKYEDLVTRAEETVRRVCSFLGLAFHPAMLAHERRAVRGFSTKQETHMANTLKPITADRVDRWQEELSRTHVAMVEHVLGAEMVKFGYGLTGTRTSVPGLRLAASHAGFELWRALRQLPWRNAESD